VPGAIDDGTVFVVTIGDDDASLATFLADRVSAELSIILRLEDPTNEQEARPAGADHVLILTGLTGRGLAHDVLREARLLDSRYLETVGIDATPSAGRSLRPTSLMPTSPSSLSSAGTNWSPMSERR